MKHLLSLTQDYLFETKFSANQVKNEATGQYHSDWVDDTKTKANGKQVIDNITALVETYDREGYKTSQYQKLWLPKEDILKMAEKIKELEAVSLVAHPCDDLPF
jgi:hypothetical protein